MTWALLQGDHYHYGNYLSPLYSPELFGNSPHAMFGPWRWPWPIPFISYSPAMLILVFPLAFRMTCYYYRGAYYKAFWADPVACAVGEPRNEYRGEAKWPLLIQNLHRYALYFALLFIVLLSIDVVQGFRFNDPATGHAKFGIGVGSLVLLVNVVLIGGYTLGCHSFRHLVGGVLDTLSRSPARKKTYDCVSCLNRQHPKWAWFSLVFVGFTDVYVRLCSMGIISRPEDHLMADTETNLQTHEHDVIVIGAGGAGLRAAIEASAAGASVGLVCKSLLGKAHTVMAEGGMAAAMAHVDDRDSWKVHFADTMRGGQYLNNWRMAELHAKEAPDRVRELEAWGAVFDRTKDGRILQRNFGGHRYPRLAHVGDRTGLEMIRTLQDHGVHQGFKVYMEHTISKIFVDGGRVAGALGYDRERGFLRVFKAKAIVHGDGRRRPRLQDHQQQLGVHGRRAGAGVRGGRRSDGHGVRAVPPDRHGLAAVGEGHPGDGGRARRGWGAAQQGRQALHVRRHPRQLQRRRPPTARKRAGSTRRATRTRAGRPSC